METMLQKGQTVWASSEDNWKLALPKISGVHLLLIVISVLQESGGLVYFLFKPTKCALYTQAANIYKKAYLCQKALPYHDQ